MTITPLFAEDLAELLAAFPSEALHSLRNILQNRWILTPFPYPRAEAAHRLSPEADLKPHAAELAREILWWGSHELWRQFGYHATWKEAVIGVATTFRVSAAKRADTLPVWYIESAILKEALARWERMSPKERREAMLKAAANLNIMAGAGAGGLGVGAYALAENIAGLAMNLGAKQLLEFAAARVGVAALGVISLALGAGWMAYDVSGPGYRVLSPAAITIAFTRQRLRDEAIAAAFGN